MADEFRKPKTLREIVEESQFWDADDLLRNIDAEFDRLEQGIDHLVWINDVRPVTKRVRPLPITPKFKVNESDDKFNVRVDLPNVPEDLVRIKVDKGGIEVSACTVDMVCRPYYINVESRTALDPDTAQIRHVESTYEVDVGKVKRKRVKIN
jgi:HSP20 family molecular chaperone IbpA